MQCRRDDGAQSVMDKGLLNRLSVSFLTLLGRKNPSDAPQTSSQTPSGELPQSEDELSGEALNGAVVLHREMSEFGEISVEEERSGVRNLVFAPGVAVQSAVIPGRPLELQLAYTRTAMAALALRPDARRILVVGLGGGAIPMFLRLALPEAVIDVAERDAAVVRIAQDFMGLRLDGHLRVRVCDGRDFMAAPGPAYDVIFLDAYGAANIPRSLASVEFLRCVRGRLSEGGLVAANIWSPAFNSMYAAMLRTYAEVFGRSLLVLDAEGSGNRLFFADRDGAPLDCSAAGARAADLVRRLNLGFDLERTIREGVIDESWPDEAPIFDRNEGLRRT